MTIAPDHNTTGSALNKALSVFNRAEIIYDNTEYTMKLDLPPEDQTKLKAVLTPKAGGAGGTRRLDLNLHIVYVLPQRTFESFTVQACVPPHPWWRLIHQHKMKLLTVALLAPN